MYHYTHKKNYIHRYQNEWFSKSSTDLHKHNLLFVGVQFLIKRLFFKTTWGLVTADVSIGQKHHPVVFGANPRYDCQPNQGWDPSNLVLRHSFASMAFGDMNFIPWVALVLVVPWQVFPWHLWHMYPWGIL